MTDPMSALEHTDGGDDEGVDGPENDEFEDLAPSGATDTTAGRGSGVCAFAVPAETQWDAADRPEGWQGQVYGLVVHTTGSGLPAKARARGVYHTVQAVDYYSGSHGCHYVNGWNGAEGGDLLQLADEREQANGVGVSNRDQPDKDQRRSIDAGRFEDDLPAVLVRRWRERWPGVAHSLDLLPGTQTVNSCYVHVECVPCVFHTDDGLIVGSGVQPLRPGLRFTQAQHDTVAALAVDVARRNGWPADQSWWRTSRLLGHEDLTPISRHDRNGGWDPGALRDEPYFDWPYVYERIESILGAAPAGSGGTGDSAEPSIFDSLGEVAEHFFDLMATGQERDAVLAARNRGLTDVNDLTNLVFFARHPEMNGRRIEDHESDLAEEWLAIRDGVVQPVLDGAPVG